MVDIYRDAKHQPIVVLDTDPEGGIVLVYTKIMDEIKCTFFFKKTIPFFLVLVHVLPVILTCASKSTNSLGYHELGEPKWISVALAKLIIIIMFITVQISAMIFLLFLLANLSLRKCACTTKSI